MACMTEVIGVSLGNTPAGGSKMPSLLASNGTIFSCDTSPVGASLLYKIRKRSGSMNVKKTTESQTRNTSISATLNGWTDDVLKIILWWLLCGNNNEW